MPSDAPGDERVSFTRHLRRFFRRIFAPFSAGEPVAAPPQEPSAARPPVASGPSWDERIQDVDHARRLVASPLFAELSEEELLAVVRGRRLQVFEPGQLIVTEGDPGRTLFVLTAGVVKVFVRNPSGHDVEVGGLREGDFFGEISSLSGRPRTATVTAAARCELLELDKPTVDMIALRYPRVRDMLDAAYIARLSSPEAIAARAVPWAEGTTRARALDVLREHFGQTRWTPRTRLRLADALFKAGRQEEVEAVLLDCVDELTREGFPEKAVALLKKVERLRRRDVEEVNLAPLLRLDAEAAVAGEGPAAVPGPVDAPAGPPAAGTAGDFESWLAGLGSDGSAAPEGGSDSRLGGHLAGLRASPLFETLSDDELQALVRGVALVRCAPGHIIVTEGEPGQSVFVVASGTVRAYARSAGGPNVELARLEQGSFFGELVTFGDRPRSATVTAASACELLELDRGALASICARHPRVREMLEAAQRAMG